jgi:hypothetical protein
MSHLYPVGAPSFPTSAVLQVLNTDELARLICSHIETVDHERSAGSQGKRDLLKVALTSKMFSEPALSQLWGSLPSLVPLVDLLPTHVDEGQYIAVSGRSRRPGSTSLKTRLQIRQDVTSYMMDRLLYYTRRIQHIHLSVGFPDSARLHPSVYLRLLTFNRSRQILPSLSSATWTFATENEDDVPSDLPAVDSYDMILLCAPPLRSARVIFGTEESMLTDQALLSSIFYHSPNLKRLYVQDSHAFFELKDVPNFRDLEVFHFSSSTLELLEEECARVFDLPTLRNLSFFNSSWDIQWRSEIDGLRHSIRCIIRSDDHDELIYCLKNMPVADSTSSLILSVNNANKPHLSRETEPGHLTQLGSILTKFSSCLRTLHIWAPHTQGEVELDHLRPFLHLALLEDVIFDLGGGQSGSDLRWSLTDADLVEIGRAWARLQTLRLISTYAEAVTDWTGTPLSPPTISGLRDLAEQCPDLRSIEMDLRVEKVDFLSVPSMGHGLEMLSVPHMDMTKDETITAVFIILRVFPSLKQIRGSGFEVESETLDLIRGLLQVTRDEVTLAEVCLSCTLGGDTPSDRPSSKQES